MLPTWHKYLIIENINAKTYKIEREHFRYLIFEILKVNV
jgi:hypothetical protein